MIKPGKIPMPKSAMNPKEITKCLDYGVETAAFEYNKGIQVAKQRGLVQGGDTSKGKFMVCCGDVMFRVVSTDYPCQVRRLF